MERCHARKSKNHSTIFELKSSVFCTPFEVGSSMFRLSLVYGFITNAEAFPGVR
jgi:hypothetical protein